jgi:hypothetical protein
MALVLTMLGVHLLEMGGGPILLFVGGAIVLLILTRPPRFY